MLKPFHDNVWPSMKTLALKLEHLSFFLVHMVAQESLGVNVNGLGVGHGRGGTATYIGD